MKLTEKRLKLDSKDGWQLSHTDIFQILSDQEKAEMYDKFEKGLGWAREMIQENKQLKEKLEKIHKLIQTRTAKLEKDRQEQLKDAPPGVCVMCTADISTSEVNRFKEILDSQEKVKIE